MTAEQKVWFITGATRGIGLQIAKSALAAGDRVVATGRDVESLTSALTNTDNVLKLKLDVTDPAQAEATAQQAKAAFGRIDVLVNNAGYGQMGVFEEISHADIEKQFATNVFGTMHLTRAVLPVMRAQKSGHIFNLSSIGGAMGFDIASIYCSTKFAVEGFSECLALEVKQFGIKVTIVQPGFFRTDFLDASSVRWGGRQIEDYAAYAQATAEAYNSQNHAQAGDPTKLGALIVTLSREAEPPLRMLAGSDAVQYLGGAYQARVDELNAWKPLSVTTDIQPVQAMA